MVLSSLQGSSIRQWQRRSTLGVFFAVVATTFGGTAMVNAMPSLAFESSAEIQVLPFLDKMLSYVGRPHGYLLSSPAGFEIGLFGLVLSGGTLAIVETGLLLILELFPKLTSQFAARKICHACSGLLFMTLDSRQEAARGAIWLIAMGSILMTWNLTDIIGIKPFRFGAIKDIGITVYLIIVMLWFYWELPPTALSPMFFADPAGAVVGKWLSRKFPQKNSAWCGKKTVGGSAAVFFVSAGTLLALYPPMSLAFLVALSAAATLAEAIGGSYDNLCLAAAVIGGYWVCAGFTSE